MRYGSVCSGIEAATVALHPLGWEPAFFSEIDAFPRKLLGDHYPGVPLHGDFTTIGADEYGSIDLLVGGTPCQSFCNRTPEEEWMTSAVTLPSNILGWLTEKPPAGWSGRTSLARLSSTEDGISPSSEAWPNSGMGGPTESLMLSTRSSLCGAAVFVVGRPWRLATCRRCRLFERHSLQGHPARDRKGKEPLPPVLRTALEVVASNP